VRLLDRRIADRIIVKSNDRMSQVFDWYFANKSWLDDEDFHAPMPSGVIELRSEDIELSFEEKSGKVEISIFPMLKPNLPAVVTFDYDPKTMTANNYRFAAHLTPERRDLLRLIMLGDQTDKKSALKYHILMLFMAHYHEIVEVTETNRRTRSEAKKLRRDRKAPLPLIRKTYVLQEFEATQLPSLSGKRSYTKPDHEVSVRGYYRHYKNGRRVWIEPFTRYKDKGKQQAKIYELQEVKQND